MASTTIKLSVETRDRLKELGGETYEDTIVAALDLLEAERFWAQAERAAAWEASLPPEERARIAAQEAELDELWDSIDD
jgi:hypothetical protein